ncbi:dihydrolipoamide acetyltransferase family protein [Shimazuella alba]|uniref:Dihydrolipoamide acetyltransferase component of pyruvate dehydrogenase complex n=1 Tax=Shimazuella alba TaxID=2690964 RepID=A0A6I4VLT8_9BACL|nr:dihydrolipoamide acetyltransferase family protein [Shimazuella alba]MXQ52377.1 2-oxo acid dehydrogenase subunit E2 [Shimazuella alba]
MAKEVFMPKLGMTMETGTIMKWLVQEGEEVTAGDIILEVMTNKINIEVEAYETGTMLKILYEEGEEVPVNQAIAYIGKKGEEVGEFSQPTMNSQLNSQVTEDKKSEEPVTEKKEKNGGKSRATPSARKLAREHDLQLTEIQGTGPNGRIHRKDVKAHIDNQIDTLPSVAYEDLAQKVEHKKDTETFKVTGMRKIIGDRMKQSISQAPHVTLHSEVDMSEAIRLRQQLLPIIEEKIGLRISYTEIILKAVGVTLRDHPMMNATLVNGEIYLNSRIDIGLAVSHSDGLLVPVIQGVDRLGMAQLSEQSKKLARAAREGKLIPNQLQGGTFTVSNLGMYRVDQFTPIINLPETAILGVGQIKERPIGVNSEIVLKPMMSLSLSFDHRTVDGAPAAAFLTQLVDTLEHPANLLV